MTAIFLMLLAIWMELRIGSSLEPKLGEQAVLMARAIILALVLSAIAYKIMAP